MKLSLLLVAMYSAAAYGEFHSSPACWKEGRSFHRPVEGEYLQYLDKLTISRVAKSEFDKVVLSPNQGYWLHITEPEWVGQERTPGLLHVYTEQDYLLLVRVDDVKFFHSATWINEKLVFMQAGWGRALGTELILDVEAERFIWNEMLVEGGTAFNQFKGACAMDLWKDSPGCQCPGSDRSQ